MAWPASATRAFWTAAWSPPPQDVLTARGVSEIRVPDIVTVLAALQADGHAVTLVDVHAALTPSDLLPDGVHPNADGMRKIAETWWRGLNGG